MEEFNLDKNKMPSHLAIIMDGNGRWAKKQGKLRTFGHKIGVNTVKEIIIAVNDLGIDTLTLYAFSTENWKRPQSEVDTLMKLVIDFLKKENDYMMKENVKMSFIGDEVKLPEKTYNSIMETTNLTKNNTGLKVNIALNYGGRDEIVYAAKNMANDLKENKIKEEDINEDLFSSYLYTKDYSEVDLLIRTGGDIRISNFLLWQIAYAELYFTETLWPDFTKNELEEIIHSFNNKERRFGGLIK